MYNENMCMQYECLEHIKQEYVLFRTAIPHELKNKMTMKANMCGRRGG